MSYLTAFRMLGVIAAASLAGPPMSAQSTANWPPAIVSQPVVQPLPVAASAEIPNAEFTGFVQLLAAKARAAGVRETTIQSFTQGLSPNQRVIELDRSQPGSSSTSAIPLFAPYKRDHVDAVRIAGGKRMMESVAPYLAAIEQRYGVPAKIMLSIWGNESNYGTFKGNFDLARALATLAWEGRRRELFSDEFVAVLKMADQGVPRERLVGSWAGAFGNPQFLPSMYLRLAQDGDGDGDKDIWHSAPDTLASIANYFKDAGWRPGEPWGVAASVPADFDRNSVANKLKSPSCPRVHARHSRWLPIAEWKNRGVQPLAPIGDTVLASLFEPDGPGAQGYLLTGNYRVILHYNCSNFYALSVGLLADEIAR